MIRRTLLILAIVCTIGCKKSVRSEVEVYSNDFESGRLESITGGTIERYMNNHVMGRYNNQSFTVNLSNLPNHNLLEISFDLYIHDSWDGNLSGDFGRNGPDIWQMIVDGNTYINTTFSNSDCGSDTFCNPQSYPLNYLNNNNNPKTGAFNKELPGVCLRAGETGGTSLYKITRSVSHTSSSVAIQCLDHLIQTNTENPKCDESWSVDNISVKAISL